MENREKEQDIRSAEEYLGDEAEFVTTDEIDMILDDALRQGITIDGGADALEELILEWSTHHNLE